MEDEYQQRKEDEQEETLIAEEIAGYKQRIAELENMVRTAKDLINPAHDIGAEFHAHATRLLNKGE